MIDLQIDIYEYIYKGNARTFFADRRQDLPASIHVVAVFFPGAQNLSPSCLFSHKHARWDVCEPSLPSISHLSFWPTIGSCRHGGYIVLFVWLISRIFSANEYYFSLTTNQPTILSAMAYHQNEQGNSRPTLALLWCHKPTADHGAHSSLARRLGIARNRHAWSWLVPYSFGL